MKREIGLRIGQCDRLDWAVLYLRLFLGSIMLFHNIGKIQNYNELISSYPSLLYIDNNAVFVIATVTEVLFSVLIMMGIWVRLSASVLAAVQLGMLIAGNGIYELQFVLMGMFVFLIVSGGGLYGFDAFMHASRPDDRAPKRPPKR